MLVRFAIISGAAVGLAVAVPQLAPGLMALIEPDEPTVTAAPVEAARRAEPERPRPERPRSLTITANTSGHFNVEARIAGRNVDLMVDTGATTVALNETTARRLGIRPSRSDFSRPISTANGVIRAAPVKLRAVALGGIHIRNVEAVVLPAEALPINLLGMSFLGRLSHFEIAGDRLVLTQ